MKYVVDANVFLAVALDEPEKTWLVNVTEGCELAAPSVLPYELANALSSLVKRRSIIPEQAAAVWDVVSSIPVELLDFDVRAALLLAAGQGKYAYDAFYLECALETRCPLLTLDRGIKAAAKALKIKLVEQP
jgi:predicted nucleic acid-binding protein